MCHEFKKGGTSALPIPRLNNDVPCRHPLPDFHRPERGILASRLFMKLTPMQKDRIADIERNIDRAYLAADVLALEIAVDNYREYCMAC